MSLFNRTYTFVDGTTAYGSQVESEIANIVTVLNSLNTAGTTWGIVSALNATSVPLIADCSSGSQDIADFKNNSVIKASIGSGGQLTLKPTTNQIVLGVTNTVTISSTAPASSRTYTMPDVGGAGTFVFLEKAQTFTAAQTLSAATGNPVHGTNTNDSASAGFTGEYSSTTTAAGTAFDVTGNWVSQLALSLTAGDWDVTAVAHFVVGSVTTRISYGVSTTTGNNTTGFVVGDSQFDAPLPVSGATSGAVVNLRFSLSTTTNVYFKTMATYTGTAPTCGARMSARRLR